MCSNFQPIRKSRPSFEWANKHFNTDLPDADWRDDAYPSYPAPFIYLDEGKPKCELATFGLIPHWAIGKKNFDKSKYNARSETVAELPTFRNAWRKRQFGLVLMQSFYEPRYGVAEDSKKSVRYRIKRSDGQPEAAACIYERVVDRSTGEIIFTFSMLTINATNHPVMKHFHRPEDEKRSIVILQDVNYLDWLLSDEVKARQLLQLAPDDFLTSEPAPKTRIISGADDLVLS